MKLAARLTRYVALKFVQVRQAGTNFREDAIELRHYWSFRLRMRTSRAWPFRLLARLRSPGVTNSQGFGKFDGKKDALSLPADNPIFDPRNDRLFCKQAALRAFGHVKVADVDDKSSASPPERTEAEELIQVQAQLAEAIKTMQAADARRLKQWKVIAVVTVVAVIAFGALLSTQ